MLTHAALKEGERVLTRGALKEGSAWLRVGLCWNVCSLVRLRRRRLEATAPGTLVWVGFEGLRACARGSEGGRA